MDMKDRGLVQPIIVQMTGSHEGAVSSAAVASVLACPNRQSGSWNDWLSERFTKTVRRVKKNDFNKLLASDYSKNEFTGLNAHEVVDSESRVVAYSPLRYEDFPRELKRAQVSGLELPRTETDVVSEDAACPTLVVNRDLKMSTGKECAQVAHAYWLAALLEEWDFENRYSFPRPSVKWVSEDEFWKMKFDADKIVVDAGLTELGGPTETVLVMLSK